VNKTKSIFLEIIIGVITGGVLALQAGNYFPGLPENGLAQCLVYSWEQ
jgi:hypothetical protein